MKIKTTALIFFMLISTCVAQHEVLPKHIEQWQPNVCQIEVYRNNINKIAVGTGVYLGGGLVLTANHVVFNKHFPPPSKIRIKFYRQGTYEGVINARDSTCDIAFIKIPIPKEDNIKGVLLASKNPNSNDIVWKCGFGGNDELIWHRCVVRTLQTSADRTRCWFVVNPHSRSGDSGGPVLNDRGELLGNIWGSDPQTQTTSIVTPTSLQKVMGSTARNILVCAHKRCYGGQCYVTPGPFYWLRPRGRVIQTQPLRPQQVRPSYNYPNLTEPAPGGITAKENPPIPEEEVKEEKPKAKLLVDDSSVITDLENKITELQNKVSQQAKQNTEVKRPPKAIADRYRRNSEVTKSKDKAGIDWSSGLGLLIIAGAGAAGVGIPTWIITAARGARRIRKIRQYYKRRNNSATGFDELETKLDKNRGYPYIERVEERYVVDAPEAKQRHRLDTQFVNVESDHYQRAHEKARQQIARRFPGSQEILEAELSLTRQFAAGDF